MCGISCSFEFVCDASGVALRVRMTFARDLNPHDLADHVHSTKYDGWFLPADALAARFSSTTLHLQALTTLSSSNSSPSSYLMLVSVKMVLCPCAEDGRVC